MSVSISGDGSVTGIDQGLNVVGVLTASGGFSGNLTGNVTGNVTGTVNSSGIATFTSGIVVSAGSTSAPSISPTGDSNTGIFFPSADTVCIGEGGSEVFRVSSSGNIGINNTNPQNPLHIVGSPGTLLRLDGGAGATGTRDIVITEFDNAAYGGIIRYDSVADLFTFGTLENSVVKSAINVNRASGIVTTPHQPSFFAYATGGDTTTADNTIIIFGATAHNTGGHYSTSTGRFTAPVTGVYAFHAQIWAKNGTGYSRAIFTVAGTQVTQNGFHPGTVSNSNDHSFQMSMVRSVSAGDAVDVRVNLGPLTYYGGGAQSHTYFTGYLIG